jgi:hypothetical protein
VSTSESKGSDSQIKTVVEQNSKSVLYDGTTDALLVSSPDSVLVVDVAAGV